MDLGIDGAAALVLGGTGGLGLSCAKHLAAAGARVALNGRDAARGAAASKALGGLPFIQGDVSDRTERARIHEQAVTRLGPLSILVTNAGGPPTGAFGDHEEAAWQAAFETNMLSAIDMVRRCLPTMVDSGFGRIVNITSFAVRQPYPNMALANGVRAGLTGAMSTLAREVMEKGVTVNNILPGLMDTGALKRVFKAQSERGAITEDEVRARMAADIPAKRLGEAEDFGPLCAFLCSRHAGYITAQNITVDGGLVRGLL